MTEMSLIKYFISRFEATNKVFGLIHELVQEVSISDNSETLDAGLLILQYCIVFNTF